VKYSVIVADPPWTFATYSYHREVAERLERQQRRRVVPFPVERELNEIPVCAAPVPRAA
jgi:hypothetical protein